MRYFDVIINTRGQESVNEKAPPLNVVLQYQARQKQHRVLSNNGGILAGIGAHNAHTAREGSIASRLKAGGLQVA